MKLDGFSDPFPTDESGRRLPTHPRLVEATIDGMQRNAEVLLADGAIEETQDVGLYVRNIVDDYVQKCQAVRAEIKTSDADLPMMAQAGVRRDQVAKRVVRALDYAGIVFVTTKPDWEVNRLNSQRLGIKSLTHLQSVITCWMLGEEVLADPEELKTRRFDHLAKGPGSCDALNARRNDSDSKVCETGVQRRLLWREVGVGDRLYLPIESVLRDYVAVSVKESLNFPVFASFLKYLSSMLLQHLVEEWYEESPDPEDPEIRHRKRKKPYFDLNILFKYLAYPQFWLDLKKWKYHASKEFPSDTIEDMPENVYEKFLEYLGYGKNERSRRMKEYKLSNAREKKKDIEGKIKALDDLLDQINSKAAEAEHYLPLWNDRFCSVLGLEGVSSDFYWETVYDLKQAISWEAQDLEDDLEEVDSDVLRLSEKIEDMQPEYMKANAFLSKSGSRIGRNFARIEKHEDATLSDEDTREIIDSAALGSARRCCKKLDDCVRLMAALKGIENWDLEFVYKRLPKIISKLKYPKAFDLGGRDFDSSAELYAYFGEKTTEYVSKTSEEMGRIDALIKKEGEVREYFQHFIRRFESLKKQLTESGYKTSARTTSFLSANFNPRFANCVNKAEYYSGDGYRSKLREDRQKATSVRDRPLDLASRANLHFDRYIPGYFLDLPDIFEESSFDLISGIRSDSHEDNKDFEADIANCLKLLRPGGIIVTDGILQSYTRVVRLQEMMRVYKAAGDEYRFEIIVDRKTGNPLSLFIQRKHHAQGFLGEAERMAALNDDVDLCDLETLASNPVFSILNDTRRKIDAIVDNVEVFNGLHDDIELRVESLVVSKAKSKMYDDYLKDNGDFKVKLKLGFDDLRSIAESYNDVAFLGGISAADSDEDVYRSLVRASFDPRNVAELRDIDVDDACLQKLA